MLNDPACFQAVQNDAPDPVRSDFLGRESWLGLQVADGSRQRTVTSSADVPVGLARRIAQDQFMKDAEVAGINRRPWAIATGMGPKPRGWT